MNVSIFRFNRFSDFIKTKQLLSSLWEARHSRGNQLSRMESSLTFVIVSGMWCVLHCCFIPLAFVLSQYSSIDTSRINTGRHFFLSDPSVTVSETRWIREYSLLLFVIGVVKMVTSRTFYNTTFSDHCPKGMACLKALPAVSKSFLT